MNAFSRCLFLCLLGSPAWPQGLITTIAGTDWIFTGSGLPGAQVPLGPVTSVAGDWKGGVFISDWDNARIFRVDSRGILTVVAGNGFHGFSGDGGPATSASVG